MSSNVMMTRFGKALLPNRPCCIRPTSLVRNTCGSRRPLPLRCEAENVAEPVVANEVVADEVVAEEVVADEVLSNGSTPPTDLNSVTFKVLHHVEFGQTVKVVGAGEGLGNWQPEVATPLNWMEGDVWTVDMELPSGPFEYKYLVIDGDGSLLAWYPGENLIGDATEDGTSLENEWWVPAPQPEAEQAPEETPITGEITEEAEPSTETEIPTTSEVAEAPEEETETETEVEITAEAEPEAVVETEVEVEVETEPEVVAEAEVETEAASVSEAVDSEEKEEEKEFVVEDVKEEIKETLVEIKEKVVSEVELETSAAVESVLDSEATEIEEEDEKSFQALSKGFGSPFFKRAKRGTKKN